ncbi:FkbM family methyltransferase [Tabrizicola piscis]|uniref:FkbM family methyltransferase n=1 Tax=Tabrizicola piscis TaxID=2494374 RepID=A0A3S8U508_9RHOB|nr:FkbM family methyltransferase [Tabrizicola piscis]AZL58693.1 FkbM family methyltransferase [Tabrizicola piscis]
MPSFTLRGLTLTLPETAIRGGLERAFTTGRYEHQEADAILAHLRPGDRFMDLGAGIGFLCALAARVLGAHAVTGVEAVPDTLALARGTLAANGFDGVRLMHGAVTGGATKDVEFGQRPAFWASALQGPEGWPPNARVIRVPALPLAALLEEHRPTVLCCDIEGAELEVLATPLTGIRLVVVELHPGLYGPEGEARVRESLVAQGFQPEPLGTKGATVVYRR